MDLMVAIKALILGVVEGLTEFLPVSSTGHLIVVGSLLDWNDEKGKLFEIVIQFAAILAVCWQYRQRLWTVVATLPRDAKSQRFTLNLRARLRARRGFRRDFHRYSSKSTCSRRFRSRAPSSSAEFSSSGSRAGSRAPRIDNVDAIKPADAIWIGFAQALSMIPGTSRSGATIMGGLLRGLSRPAATEFSFFLAIPTILGATVLSLFKARHSLNFDDLAVIGVGSVASFVSAMIAVRALHPLCERS